VRQKETEAFQTIAAGINTSITDSENHFNATLQREKTNLSQTLGGLKETINAATGGDGFCYVIIVPPDSTGSAIVISVVVPQGNYPLTNVNALVTDDDMVIKHLDEVNNTENTRSADAFANTMLRAQEWLHVGDLPPRFSEQITMRAATLTGDRRMVSIVFWANNGSWTEKFALRRVNGKWLRLIRVWRERLDKKKNAFVSDVLFNQVDEGFPEDTNTKDEHGVSASPH
jgi:hypothetical protein